MNRESEQRGEGRAVRVSAGPVELEGNLGMPQGVRGVVLFAHGSGSGRYSPRNRYVARVLRQAGLATLLIDLLTPEEEEIDLRTRHLRFDIGLLAVRLTGATDWLKREPDTRNLRVGYFGASTGALGCAGSGSRAPRGSRCDSLARGGRPDLAGDALPR